MGAAHWTGTIRNVIIKDSKGNINLETRNSAVGFVQRTRKNLEFVRTARETKQDVHLGAHLINSLLGLVVIPIEKHAEHMLWAVSLEDLHDSDWPKWTILKDERGTASKNTWTPTKTLGRLIVHLRNAAAHGKFMFEDNPESRNLSEVRLIVEDGFPEKPTNWRAEIGGEELYQFCLLLSERVEAHLRHAC